MKITIDTKEDSPEDIKKVMHILAHFASSGSLYNSNLNPEGKSENTDTTSMMNMFGDNSEGNSLSKTDRTSGTPPDFSSFLNLTGKKVEKKEDIPEIEIF